MDIDVSRSSWLRAECKHVHNSVVTILVLIHLSLHGTLGQLRTSYYDHLLPCSRGHQVALSAEYAINAIETSKQPLRGGSVHDVTISKESFALSSMISSPMPSAARSTMEFGRFSQKCDRLIFTSTTTMLVHRYMRNMELEDTRIFPNFLLKQHSHIGNIIRQRQTVPCKIYPLPF